MSIDMLESRGCGHIHDISLFHIFMSPMTRDTMLFYPEK